MGDATATFFDGLEALGHVPALEKVSGTLRFDLKNGKRTTRWLVTVDKGDVAVSHRNAKADCVVRAEKTVFERIAFAIHPRLVVTCLPVLKNCQPPFLH